MQERASDVDRLLRNYSAATTDFYGRGIFCVYKTPPSWPLAPYGEPPFVREARTIVRQDAVKWGPISGQIHQALANHNVDWDTMDAFAYANEGQAKPFCPIVLQIGCAPGSLPYDRAVQAAQTITEILRPTTYASMEVAFTETTFSRFTTSASGSTSRLVSPNFEALRPGHQLLGLQKPFTPLLGLPIAPLKQLGCEATGGFFLALDREEPGKGRVALATVAHGVRPPPVAKDNVTISWTNRSQPRQEICILGEKAYADAQEKISDASSGLDRVSNRLKREIDSAQEQGALEASTKARREDLASVEAEKAQIDELARVTGHFSTGPQRAIGFVLHAEEIMMSVEPHGYTRDWALVELYNNKIDWGTFPGNKVYIGDLREMDFVKFMFPQVQDRAGFNQPHPDFLQAYGVVQQHEIQNPQHLDINNEPCLLVVKHGATTGTTTGRVNGLESFTRSLDAYNIKQISKELAILEHPPKRYGAEGFSADGDSGSIILDRVGRFVGMVTGGHPSQSSRTDITYATPFWWLLEDIQAKFPAAALYDLDNSHPRIQL